MSYHNVIPLEKLKNKMLLMGHLDYQKFCEEFFGKMILE